MPLEDVSNADVRFLRNRVRHELLPLLESLNPGIRATLLRNAEVTQVDVEWIEEQVSDHLQHIVLEEQAHFIELDVERLLLLPLSLQRHLLRRVTARLYDGQSLLELRHYRLIEQLFQHASLLHQHRESKLLDLPHGLRLIYNFKTVVFERLTEQNVRERADLSSPIPMPVRLPIPGRVAVPGTSWVAVAELLPDSLLLAVLEALECEDWPTVWRLLPANRHTVYIDAATTGTVLEVRTRRAGDRLRPLGMADEKKVKEILIDKHIPRAERNTISLFFSPSHCVWLAGVSLDDRVRLTCDTQHIIRLSVEPVLSDESG